MKKNIVYSMVLLLSCTQLPVCGQGVRSKKAEDYFKVAEKEYRDQRYMYSIPFYRTGLKYPGTSSKDSIAMLHLADAYWHVKNYDSAVLFYRQFESKFGSQFITTQHLAELSANKKEYAAAAAGYKKLLSETPGQSAGLLKERLKGFSNTAPFLRDSLNYAVKLLKLNTVQQDFSPQYYGQGLVFVSNRFSKTSSERQFGWDGLPYSSVYWIKDTADLYTVDSIAGYAKRVSHVNVKANDDYTAKTSNDNDIILLNRIKEDNQGSVNKLLKFSDQLSTKYNYGPLCFNKEGNKVYFTRNSLKAEAGRYNLEVCEATNIKGEWTDIKVMPFVQPAYDFFHPALNADGTKLYFCSNKPGGKGGTDIYYVGLSADFDMSNPINVDDKINTAGDELFPNFHGDTLYYSSDGLAGLGGLDIYRTYQKRGSWQKPENVGYPVNSSFDDFGMIINQNTSRGFFSSNRLGSDDIYVFNYAPFFVTLKGTVLSRTTLRRLDSAKVIIRTVVDDKPVVDSVTTDLTGNFEFPVKPHLAYTLESSRRGYVDTMYRLPAIGTDRELALEPTLLTPVTPKVLAVPVLDDDRDKDGVPDKDDRCPDVKGVKENFGCPDVQARINELAKMVFFKTASAELSPVALKPLNEIADIMAQYPWITLSIEGHTDSVASAPYNLDLSNRRAHSVRTFFIKRGLSPSRFTAVGYGLTRPIADNRTVEGRALNRRVAMKADFHSKY